MSRFVLSPEARQDLIDIWEYIAQDNIDAADRVVGEIRNAMTTLAQNPRIGHFRKDLADEALRFWRVFTYLVIYRPETKPIEIVRVLSAYRDIRKLLE
jgi:antitoxin ParD1/3/4/toxin ParE1/3/4